MCLLPYSLFCHDEREFQFWSMVGTGGYSPFGPTTQKRPMAKKCIFFSSMFVLNGAYPVLPAVYLRLN